MDGTLHPLVSKEEAEPLVSAPTDSYVFHFPLAFEDRLKPLDDLITSSIQRFSDSKVIRTVCVAITGCFAIEVGLVMPFLFYCMGLDTFGVLSLGFVLALTLISQVPKRFIWRFRPWHVGRAKTIAKDQTSSFPSRGVACAVVYGYLLSCIPSGSPHFPVMIPLVLALIMLSSYARIFVGAHYASDCFFGALEGIISILCGTVINVLFSLCGPCSTGLCYGGKGDVPPIDRSLSSLASNLNWVIIGLSVILLFGLVATSLMLTFWSKFEHAFGMLLSCCCFRLWFLCPALMHSALRQVSYPPSVLSCFIAIMASSLLTVIGMKLKTKTTLAKVGKFCAEFSIAGVTLMLTR